jgi:hypothetical protein
MCLLPLNIDESERIVRIVLCDLHIKKNSKELRHQLFRSKVGTDDVSVVRYEYKGVDFCREKGAEISKTMRSQSFVGLAVIVAESIRFCGSRIDDSRHVYCGHAHISHGLVSPPANDPACAEDNYILTERHKALLKYTTYYPDPAPDAEMWTGTAF